MKVLLLTTALSGTSYKGCGWVGACIDHLAQLPDIRLGVGYLGNAINSPDAEISFFPISVWRSRKNRLRRRFHLAADEELVIPETLKIIAEFQPDIIHVFGSENPFGLIASLVDIPVLIHLQGFLPSYYNAKYPPGQSFRAIWFSLFRQNPLRAFHFAWREKLYRHCVKREISVIKKGGFFCGRTDWDRAIVEVIHPVADYFYCSEFLRGEFWDYAGKWQLRKERKTLKLLSVISPATFKGADVILKTAKWLREFAGIAFEWKVYGVSSAEWQDPLWGRLSADQTVQVCGVASPAEIIQAALKSDVFIHTSYIDNSPNSVCEAQLLGMPVIAIDAGGVSSIVQNGVTGILVPANDPLMMANRILELYHHPEKAVDMGKTAAEMAAKRHNPKQILQDLQAIYAKMLTKR